MTAIASEPIYDDDNAPGLGDYIAMVKRRLWLMIGVAVTIFVVAAAVALLLPPVYRSEATILIEQPDVPPELVASTITGYATERIQAINQRVMATEKLSEIINKHNLYADERARTPMSTVVQEMRDNISLDLIGAGLKSKGGGSGDATIAFGIAFQHDNAAVAQRVANDLTSLYLSENLRTRQQKASETADFLADEAKRLGDLISDLERKLADLKQHSAGSLPEQLDYNLQLMARAEEELRALDQRAHAIEERQIYLDSELAQMNPHAVVGASGERLSTPQARLEAFRTELIMASAKYGPTHPDVVNLRKQVAALERETKRAPDLSGLRGERDRIRADLAQASERYGREHPDVTSLTRQLAAAEAALKSAGGKGGDAGGGDSADNPAYIQLRAQREAARIELETIAMQRDAIKASIAAYGERIEKTPLVERQYRQLARAYEDAKLQYRDIKSKQITASLGEALETQQKSERFSLIDPPSRPGNPVKPNRLMILALGVVLSIGGGIGSIVLAEAMDSSVHGTRGVVALTGSAPLVVVPYIRTRAEIRRAWRRRGAIAAAVVVMLGGAVLFVHYRITPLDVLQARAERSLDRYLPFLAADREPR